MSRTIRLGVIGAGLAVRQLHWPALEALGERYKIVALSARTDASLEETGALVGCNNFYHDYHEMIGAERDGLDAVLVSLPIGMLLEGAEAAAAAGLDVLCEKPAGGSLEQGRAFLSLPERYGVSVQILENFRYRDDLRRVREEVDQGTIGDLVAVRITSMSYNKPRAGEFASTPWRQRTDYVGGPLLDAGVHHTAAFHVLAGRVARIGGVVASTDARFEGVDIAFFTLEFESGVIGSYAFGYRSFETQDTYTNGIRLYGTSGTLHITDEAVRLVTEAGERSLPIEPDNGYRNEFLNFYEHKTEGVPLRVTPNEAFDDLRVLLSGLQAAREGQVAELR